MDLSISHDPAAHQFAVQVEGHTAELDYVVDGATWVFTHTYVPDALRGQGVAGQLVKAGFSAARAASVKVVPQCSFVATYFERHPEHADLRA